MSSLDALAQLLPSDRAERYYGVVIGLVSNNQDPDKLGRVKLRFPWLSDSLETSWVRVAVPMAGKQRGFYFLPEVNDEVLVAFEHGQIEFPYVLGALWNGKDTPPDVNSDGKNNLRMIQSRSGHIVRLDDTAGAEKIEILDKSGKNKIVIDTAGNSITINADADVTISAAKGKLKLSGQSIELSSQTELKIQADAGMEMSANGQMKIQGTTVDIN